MVEPLPLAEGWDALARERERRRARRERRRRAVQRAIPWLARVVLGVLPVAIGWLFWVWALLQRPLDASRIGALTLVSLYAACVAVAVWLHSDLGRLGRRTATFALGLALGLLLALLPRALASWRETLEVALELPLLLVLGTFHDPLRAFGAAAMSLWILGPSCVALVCAWDAVRALRSLRGSGFDFRDARWILLGLLLGFASNLASAFWPGRSPEPIG
jgi:hypothetical protein